MASSIYYPGFSVSVERLVSNQKVNKRRIIRIRCSNSREGGDKDKSSVGVGVGGKVLLKSAWYASELLGIAASFFRPSTPSPSPSNEEYDNKNRNKVLGVVAVDRAVIVETIKGDFERSYFVTGAVSVDAYEDDCEFADPAGSFKGVWRFKRNCTNFGSLILKSDMNLIRWEDDFEEEEDKGIGHWRFTCTMAFPWKPILSATGYTEYYLSKQSGKVCRHVEHWNVPKMALFKQLLRPSRQTNPSK
ncbi:hypothetical protein M8C21_032141 [Ambrosia artemisiifolia]|uniref:Uncharacterized protein n=1 Tax=Ambrosia artemisiifolia TaxID=4212 RepID=A0AAD5GD37_AMBAR|nr:hypothetical protein M8C21_032141 [Ambrosia artemisiifolia]